MNKFSLHIFFGALLSLYAQTSPFKTFDIVIYPEYYFSGVMAEIEAEAIEGNLPLDLKFQVPSSTDSIFYVSGDVDTPSIEEMNFSKEGRFSYINKKVNDKKFRIFVFYDLDKNGTKRTGKFDFQLNHPVDDAHIVVQEPLVSNNFIFSEQNHEDFKDQHGINFKRIHVNNYASNFIKSVSFTYDNPTQDISMNALQKGAQNSQNADSPQNAKPIRHTLPLWQPLVALGVVSVVVGGMFYRQISSEASLKEQKSKPENSKPAKSKGKFCTECGNKILPMNKFCANCGAKL